MPGKQKKAATINLQALKPVLESDDESYTSFSSFENEELQKRFYPNVTQMLVRHGILSEGEKLNSEMYRAYLPVFKQKYLKSKARKKVKHHDLLFAKHIYQQCCENGLEPFEKNLSYDKFQSLGLHNWDLRLVENGMYFKCDSSYNVLNETNNS